MERLAELREQRVLTLRELSAMSGVAADTINQIELGHRKPRPSTLRKLAKALGVEVEDFFRESEAPKEDAPPPPEPSEERREFALSGTATGRSSASGKMSVEVSLALLWQTEAALEAVENVVELEPDKQRQVREARNQVREALAQGLNA